MIDDKIEIDFAGDEIPDSDDKEFIVKHLPKRKTKIVTVKYDEDLLYLKLFTDCTNVDEVKQWISDYEELTKTSYSISTTKNTTGRYIEFKQYLHCIHKTKAKDLYDSSKDVNKTRNTNCPSTVTITLHSKKKRYQGKDKLRNALLKEMRCEINLILTHNHNVSFRKVSQSVKEKLIDLFSKGCTPRTALKEIKMDIYSSCDNYKDMLDDRAHCPDYSYCYKIYTNLLKNKYGTLDFDSTDFFESSSDKCEEEMGDDSFHLVYEEAAHDADLQEHENTKEAIMFETDNIINNAELIKCIEERAQEVCQEFYNMCVRHIENSPSEVGLALEKMSENMKKIRTRSAFISSCTKFASRYHQKNGRSFVQPITMHPALSGCQSTINKSIRKKRPPKISKYIGDHTYTRTLSD